MQADLAAQLRFFILFNIQFIVLRHSTASPHERLTKSDFS